MNTSVFLKALNILERGGWCQGVSTDDSGRQCIGMAIHRAVAHNSANYMLRTETIESIVGGTGDIVCWNDRKKTTFDDVRAALLAGASLELSNP